VVTVVIQKIQVATFVWSMAQQCNCVPHINSKWCCYVEQLLDCMHQTGPR